ncbi:hypothetical protein GNI_050130 [Gregarina niphandrodes]|uniref:Uncharacterized protein n=1 Tax=Gregarina niphandrodes TaxID=110365 RepID=A0A023B9G4_GRENI|nr:hypothetical protein GNI_050130 [Gregarina niphandrodes]EZG72963.1 hypothetical protein GNI_050130 [Gregarina niphandrodes]|eukprot:XP_011129722.1 hypothetical protein GNI_050130 [Gregarina niphandrodes]
MFPAGKGTFRDRSDRAGGARPLTQRWAEYKQFVREHFSTIWAKHSESYEAHVSDFEDADLRAPEFNKVCRELLSYIRAHRADELGSRARVQLAEGAAATLCVLQRVSSDFQTQPELEASFTQDRARTPGNVLFVCYELQKRWSPGGAVCAALEDLLRRHVFIPTMLQKHGLLESAYISANGYSMFAINLLLQHAIVLGFQPATKRLRRLASCLEFCERTGLRNFETYEKTSKTLHFFASSFKQRENAILRAASGRGRLSREDLADSYVMMFRELAPGEAVEINSWDLQWFDTDAFCAVTYELVTRVGFGKPHPNLVPLNIFPLLQPYLNYYRQSGMSISFGKTETGSLRISLGWNLQREVATGGKTCWVTCLTGCCAPHVSVTGFTGYENVFLERWARDRRHGVSYDVAAPAAAQIIRDVFQGHLNLNKLQQMSHGSANTHGLNHASTFIWNKTFLLGVVNAYVKYGIHPKHVTGFFYTANSVSRTINSNELTVLAPRNKEASRDLIQRTQKTREHKGIWVHIHEAQVQAYWNTRSIAPHEFGEVIKDGAAMRNLQPMIYTIWDSYNSRGHKITTLKVLYNEDGSQPKVTVVFESQPSRSSQELPLNGFDVEDLIRSSRDARIADWIADVDQPSVTCLVECVVDARLVRMAWNAKSKELNRNLLLKFLEMRSEKLRIKSIHADTTTPSQYNTRMTWALWCFSRHHGVEAGVRRRSNKMLQVEYDETGNYVSAQLVHPNQRLAGACVHPFSKHVALIDMLG